MRLRPGSALAGAAVALALLAAAPRAAAQGKFELAVATESRDVISHHDVFAPSAARIYVIYKVTLAKPSRVKAVWITEKVEGYQENQKFADSGSNLQAGTFMGAFSNGRPGNAWPAGAYRVDLYVDDKLEKAVRFKVSK